MIFKEVFHRKTETAMKKRGEQGGRKYSWLKHQILKSKKAAQKVWSRKRLLK
jgi:hypothetical protein